MSKNVTSVAIFALTISCVFAGCGGGAESNKIRKAKSQGFQEEYTFEQNGCATGKHKFNGPSKVDVLKKKCEALRDPVRNKSCAEPLRKAEFKKNCQGSWDQQTPQEDPADKKVSGATVDDKNDASTSSSQGVGLEDAKIDSKLQSALQKLIGNSLVARVIPKDLEKSEDKIYFAGLIKGMEACSLNSVGSACFDYTPNGVREALVRNSATSSYLVEFQRLGRNQAPVILSFEVIGEFGESSFVEKQTSVKSVTILESLTKPRREALSEFVKKSANVREIALLDIEPPGSKSALLKKKLESPATLRELVHMVKLSEKDSTPYLREVIKNRPDLIVKAQDPLYQQHFISMLLEGAKLTFAEGSSVVTQLLASSDEGVKQAAAAFLFPEATTHAELRTLAMSALDHQLWPVRKAAVLGLSKATLSKAEENRILALLADTTEVSEAVFQVASESLKMTVENIEALGLLRNSSLQTRDHALALLKKISDVSATHVIVSMLAGEDNKLSRKVFEELNKRPLDNDLRLPLRKIIEEVNNSDDSRVYAVRLLAKINTSESQADIKALQKIIKDASVKEEIEYALK